MAPPGEGLLHVLEAIAGYLGSNSSPRWPDSPTRSGRCYGRQVPHRLDAWMYRGGRPNRLARVLNRLWSRMAASGRAPQQLHSLEVRGRRRGRSISLPVVVADYEGERYLVSMLGEDVNWVANVRAAGGHAVLRHGEHEDVRLEEIDRKLRGPILRRYLQLSPGARAHIAVDPSASVEEFNVVAAKYPVFLIRPDPAHTNQ
jgi:hypothetical protein